jgi:hypothetical protein
MKAIGRSMMLAGVIGIGILGWGATPAHAQAFGFNYSSPGFSFGLGTGGYGVYGGGYYAAYPYVVPAPVVVPQPVVVPGPVVVPRPWIGPRPYSGYWGGWNRPYPYRYRRY